MVKSTFNIDIINSAIINNNRVYIEFTEGSIQFGVNKSDITSKLLELLKLMPRSVVTELLVDFDNNFLRLAFENEELIIHKCIEFNFDYIRCFIKDMAIHIMINVAYILNL
jgi:hypothetical protein